MFQFSFYQNPAGNGPANAEQRNKRIVRIVIGISAGNGQAMLEQTDGRMKRILTKNCAGNGQAMAEQRQVERGSRPDGGGGGPSAAPQDTSPPEPASKTPMRDSMQRKLQEGLQPVR